IKTYLKSNPPQEGSFTYQFTACLCKDQPRRFFWDFQTNETMTIAAVVDITAEKGICPYDLAVRPITANRFVTYRKLEIY
ncbi:Prolactin-inducible protein, partial [Galemys pyrenaicus]